MVPCVCHAKTWHQKIYAIDVKGLVRLMIYNWKSLWTSILPVPLGEHPSWEAFNQKWFCFFEHWTIVDVVSLLGSIFSNCFHSSCKNYSMKFNPSFYDEWSFSISTKVQSKYGRMLIMNLRRNMADINMIASTSHLYVCWLPTLAHLQSTKQVVCMCVFDEEHTVRRSNVDVFNWQMHFLESKQI